MSALKKRRDSELLHAGDKSRRRHVAFGHKESHFIARTHPKGVGKISPENYAKASGL